MKKIFFLMMVIGLISGFGCTHRRAESSPVRNSVEVDEANLLYAKALEKTQTAQYIEAAKLWQSFISHYTGLTRYEHAWFYYGKSLFNLGKFAEAADALRNPIDTHGNTNLIVEARLLLADCLLKQGQAEEALALTYELRPDIKIERRYGIVRHSLKVPPLTVSQKVRLYSLRGGIYAVLQRRAQAQKALQKARNTLSHAQKDQLNEEDRRTLSGRCALRELEVLRLQCSHEASPTERLSEAEFLSYSTAHYSCAEPARELYCEVARTEDKHLLENAVATYKALVFEPLKLKDRLPAPTREISKKNERAFYEKEFQDLIEKTVQNNARDFQNIDSCQAYNIF